MRLPRSGLVVLFLLASACSEAASPTTPDAPTSQTTIDVPTASAAAPSDATTTPPTTASAAPTKPWRHPRDAEGHLVMRKPNGTCYVQAQKKDPPPKDLMSGERWVEDKTVPCPPEYADPAFAAIGEGMYWIKNAETGECSQGRTFGDPPVPPTKAPCPPVIPH